ncbi:FkbM family methyltransferase [Marinobacter confluentis]|uniref:FkbM family methyltransferase n=1 Tax=Marinobacter confluentis TaxID=1697557 RepID=A0A4Z1C9C8_9GAMM|nr:FkbM family methyltransferase [Marinobacter confluentis]TGN39966.1 FkbM family methyltransferase [Marinobacter confluentis]
MSNLKILKKLYKSGGIKKPDYIQQASSMHQILFDYSDFIKETDIREINISNEGVIFDIGDDRIKMIAPRDENRVAPIEILNFDSYEPTESKIMDALSAKASSILDVGANIGWFSLRFAKQAPEAHIYAFEPIPKSFTFLLSNVSLNQLGSRISCFNYGLSDTSGSVDFYVAPTSNTNASLKNVAADANAKPVKSLILTLDDWCANYSVAPDVIKCDVEGAELLVFRGGEKTIERYTPIIFTELLRKWSKSFSYHPNDLLDYFDNLGYSCFAISGSGCRILGKISDKTSETNYIFLHKEKHSKQIQFVENFHEN